MIHSELCRGKIRLILVRAHLIARGPQVKRVLYMLWPVSVFMRCFLIAHGYRGAQTAVSDVIPRVVETGLKRNTGLANQ